MARLIALKKWIGERVGNWFGEISDNQFILFMILLFASVTLWAVLGLFGIAVLEMVTVLALIACVERTPF